MMLANPGYGYFENDDVHQFKVFEQCIKHDFLHHFHSLAAL